MNYKEKILKIQKEKGVTNEFLAKICGHTTRTFRCKKNEKYGYRFIEKDYNLIYNHYKLTH